MERNTLMGLKLLVSMGIKPDARVDVPLRPCLKEVDVDEGRVTRSVSYEVRPEHTPGPYAHQEFTSASWSPCGLLLQPAHTELLWIDPDNGGVVRRMSHPLFHGIHSAHTGIDGVIALTAAGLDSVLWLDRGGTLLDHRYLAPGSFDDRFDRSRDYRKVDHDALKPHVVHPNHAWQADGEWWVTCFETRCARSLDDAARIIALDEAIPHDGRMIDGLLWFTQVDGRIVAVDPVHLRRRRVVDLRRLTSGTGMLGWCRGIEVVGDRLFVGMTMLRRSRHREVMRMVMRGLAGKKRPTRVVEVDLKSERIVQDIPVGNAAGGTIYAINAQVARPMHRPHA